MNILSILAISLFFTGCPSTGDNTSNSNVKEEPLYAEQWALHYDQNFYDKYAIDSNAHIHMDLARQRYTGKGVKIAIIDISFDKEHFEYTNNIIFVNNSVDNSTNIQDTTKKEFYHGTAVAGIISSNINQQGLAGIAPNAKIILISLGNSVSSVANAFTYAKNKGADIINCSWGTTNVDPLIKDIIDDVATTGRNGKGIVVVFSSGNENINNPNDEAMLDSVIGVGATDETNLRSVYSNFGAKLDIVAPGGYSLGITTTYDSNNSSHQNDFMQAKDLKPFIGTSAAAPIVSGAIALLLEKNPNLTRVEVQNILKNSTDKIGIQAYINGRNDYYGYGKLNIDKMLEQ
ncbi:Protease [hydrothermal vent metagenome]|uniref:Protease n=1 Tax=hydrothermal vent metagenome TaxID=652676 RepID=A0A3B1E6H0_9ZZZZ